jgi:hypothetical protein
MVPISNVLEKLTDNDKGDIGCISRNLGMSLFDLQNGCRRRFVVHSSMNEIGKVDLIKFPSCAFVALVISNTVPELEMPLEKMWQNTNWTVITNSAERFNNSSTSDIHSHRSGSITLIARVQCVKTTGISLPEGELMIRAERTSRSNGGGVETVAAFTMKVPGLGPSPSPVVATSPEFKFNLKPERDIWWLVD